MTLIRLLLLPLILTASVTSAQTLLEELLPEIEGEILRDLGSSTPIPTYVEEVQPAVSDVAEIANLRGLDRINGTVQDFSLNVGDTVQYERLEITLTACRYPRGDINADAFAQLIIRDIREDFARFTGWMFASSPALSALDHPRYDVWVLSCQSSLTSD